MLESGWWWYPTQNATTHNKWQNDQPQVSIEGVGYDWHNLAVSLVVSMIMWLSPSIEVSIGIQCVLSVDHCTHWYKQAHVLVCIGRVTVTWTVWSDVFDSWIIDQIQRRQTLIEMNNASLISLCASFVDLLQVIYLDVTKHWNDMFLILKVRA